MKKIMIVLAVSAFTAGFAQENKMKKSETTITKTTVVDNKGVDVSTKSVTDTEKEAIAIEEQVDATNFNTTVIPVMSNSEVSYSHDGSNYAFEAVDNGYKLMSLADDKTRDYAIIRPSSREGYYIYYQNGYSSMGYFDQDGNFIIESYDAENDTVISTVYKLQASTVVKKE
jgi:hypothetical protein